MHEGEESLKREVAQRETVMEALRRQEERTAEVQSELARVLSEMNRVERVYWAGTHTHTHSYI